MRQRERERERERERDTDTGTGRQADRHASRRTANPPASQASQRDRRRDGGPRS